MPDCSFSNGKNLRSDAITFEGLRAPFHEFEEKEPEKNTETPPETENVLVGLPPSALELETADIQRLGLVVVVIFVVVVVAILSK